MVAERLACSPLTKATRVTPDFRMWESCRWSPSFLGDLPFPPPFHSGSAPYSPQSPSSALKTWIQGGRIRRDDNGEGGRVARKAGLAAVQTGCSLLRLDREEGGTRVAHLRRRAEAFPLASDCRVRGGEATRTFTERFRPQPRSSSLTFSVATSWDLPHFVRFFCNESPIPGRPISAAAVIRASSSSSDSTETWALLKFLRHLYVVNAADVAVLELYFTGHFACSKSPDSWAIASEHAVKTTLQVVHGKASTFESSA
ncbi:hypothetical protein PR048_010462 [Dryococelus australis]|uniref:Uncharacterized protein n=1 Tax=Dryococelus australis TaxID=614101 RepID=A0ABQ9I2U1_9NEOP|nr:hypothetical protein PR048_010462 [Dryococelus australis]